VSPPLDAIPTTNLCRRTIDLCRGNCGTETSPKTWNSVFARHPKRNFVAVCSPKHMTQRSSISAPLASNLDALVDIAALVQLNLMSWARQLGFAGSAAASLLCMVCISPPSTADECADCFQSAEESVRRPRPERIELLSLRISRYQGTDVYRNIACDDTTPTEDKFYTSVERFVVWMDPRMSEYFWILTKSHRIFDVPLSGEPETPGTNLIRLTTRPYSSHHDLLKETLLHKIR